MSFSQDTNSTNSDEAGVERRHPTGMQHERITKYRSFPQIALADRQWPSRTINQAPIWCSVDLRDGNQALAVPMSVQEKLEMFQLLVDVGFKEIEVGFPAASQIEYDFLRRLVEEDRIPRDVTVQVLVQAREELIYRTFESLYNVKRAIVHIYNSTSPVQRRVVFDKSKPEIIDIAVRGVELIRSLASHLPDADIQLQYSPESFSSTEVDFALEICEAVVDVWQPSQENRIILNLPATVETATPNVYADQIEWFCRHLRNRKTAAISLHTHNDRGTGVAATELGLLAGADRVEGTLFGNGERTGNVDIVTVALNLYSQGVDPQLDFSNINAVRAVYERCTRMTVHERHPYAGDLVFTAFSGSHQDAIRKGMAIQDKARTGGLPVNWEVPYLPIDPKDIGRTYEAIIRINAQSGKGGVAYVLEQDHGIHMPKAMQVEFGRLINQIADTRGDELSPQMIRQVFEETYLGNTSPFSLEAFQTETEAAAGEESYVRCSAKVNVKDMTYEIGAVGNGPIDAFVRAMQVELVSEFAVRSYAEHALSQGASAKAIAYIEIQMPSGQIFFGAGVDTSIDLASVKAVLSGLNRAYQSNDSAIETIIGTFSYRG